MTKDTCFLFPERADVVTVYHGVTIYMPQAVFLPGSPDHPQKSLLRIQVPEAHTPEWLNQKVCL